MAKTPEAPKTAPTQSTKPGTPAPTAKEKRPERVDFPGLKGADGKAVKLTEWPKDFDGKVHKPLHRGDFQDEAVYLDHKAAELEDRAKRMRQEAADARLMGNAADRQKAKKLRAMQERMKALETELTGSLGAEKVAELMAKLAVKTPEDAPKEAPKA